MSVSEYRFLRVEDGYCAYDQHRLQPVAVFEVNDRRGEVSFSRDVVDTRMANKTARREAEVRYGIIALQDADDAEERAALQAIEAHVAASMAAPAP